MKCASPGAGMVADNGLLFGNRNGLRYGWKCAMPSLISGGIGQRALAPYFWLIGSGSMGIGYSVSTGLNAVPDVNTTYAANLGYSTCADNSQNNWEIQVPNGVYRVRRMYSRFMGDELCLRRHSALDCHCTMSRLVQPVSHI